MAVNTQPPPSSNHLPSQPLPNLKGGINMVQTANEKGAMTEEEDNEEEEDDDWLYELLAKLAGEDSVNEGKYEEAEEEETTEEDKEDEMVEIDEEATKEEVSSLVKEEEFFIATVYGGNEEKPKDFPEKCADPEPCFVTCKIGKVYVPDYLCDPRACASVIPTPRNNNGCNPQVLLGRPFLKTAGFKLNFNDETFSLEIENAIEIFQPTRPPISQEESVRQARKEESVGEIKQKETVDPTVTPKQKKE
ncbi:hypothetical protein PIB30_059801 [Stylosanthes scabra]|uniref:Uncharacterized protein n=1 Tax=Stylosanthes scabra TaxID=79078 RepID=A0ABU6YHT8_9FABA|nr:hypothetical protein [Stylosanthes scabra]